MIVPPIIDRQYSLYMPYLGLLEGKVEATVFAYCKANKFAYSQRTKDVQSLAEKLESGRYSAWSELDDLFACTVILPTLTEEGRVIDFLQQAFQQIRLTRRGQVDKPPDVFRFDATRFIGRLRPVEGDDLPPEVGNISFEIQIRSAFEHAWSVTTHALAYKSKTVDWAHLRLAAQLKAAVEQLDSLILTFEQAATGIAEASWPDVRAKAEIATLFTQLVQDGNIPTESAPKDWSRFSDNLYSLLQACPDWPRRREQRPQFITQCLSSLADQIRKLDYSTFPRSISLHQLVVGMLSEGGLVRSPLARFTPIITDELRTLYPSVATLTEQFVFETQ